MSSGPTMTTTMLGSQASMLVISSVDYHHSGVYTCRAENIAGVSTYSAELKVNGDLTERHGNIYLQNSSLYSNLIYNILISENDQGKMVHVMCLWNGG